MVTLRIHPKVTQDLLAALKYYEERQPGLERNFLSAFDQTVASLTFNPQRWRKFRGAARRARLKVFPYVIVFTFANDVVDIFALVHVQRHPDVWIARVEN